MNIGDLNRSLIAKANSIGQRRIKNTQAQLVEILQDAAPDSAVSQDENGVRITARRLFERMMTNEELRSPHSFFERFFG